VEVDEEGGELLADMEATMDLRETDQLVPMRPPRSAQARCDTIRSIAGEEKCFPCASDGAPYCVRMKAFNIHGVKRRGVDLPPRDWDETYLE
jgi:hypothetical protein